MFFDHSTSYLAAAATSAAVSSATVSSVEVPSKHRHTAAPQHRRWRRLIRGLPRLPDRSR